MTKILRLRLYQGLRQIDFAEKCSLGQSTIQSIERGNRTRVVSAKLVANALAMPINELFMTGIDPRYLYPIKSFDIGDSDDN